MPTPIPSATAFPAAGSMAERNAWVAALRPPRPARDPRQPAGWHLEQERGPGGALETVLTLFLTNRECPWRCVFCDLWQHAVEAPVTGEDLLAQVDAVLRLPAVKRAAPTTVKVYNAGSYLDAAAVPPSIDAEMARRLAAFSRVIVESHPSLVGHRCWRFRDLLARAAADAGRRDAPMLEVAMGVETAHEAVLERLNKGVTLAGIADTARELLSQGVAWRAFILVQPPFETPHTAVHWAARSAVFALEHGATAAVLIPLRAGNGAVEALAAQGAVTPLTLERFEEAFEAALGAVRDTPGGRVFADLWDLERWSSEPGYEERCQRLSAMNASQEVLPRVTQSDRLP